MTLLDWMYGAYLLGVIVMWYWMLSRPPIMRVWETMTFKERMASLVCTSILLVLPADGLYDLLTLHYG